MGTDRLFTGQRLDDTGLYYYGARYYDPTIGRFISADSIVPSIMNPQSLNRFAYALNNPLKYNDPTGYWPNWGGIIDRGKSVVSGFTSGVSNAWSSASNYVSSTWSSVSTAWNNYNSSMETGSYLGDIGQVFLGEGDAFVNAGKGIYQTVTDLPGTATNFVSAASDLQGTAQAIAEHYSSLAETNRGRGEIAGEVMIAVLAPGLGPAIKGSAEAGHFSKLGIAASSTSGLKYPSYVNLSKPNTLVSYAKNLEQSRTVLTTRQANQLVADCQKVGLELKFHIGHVDTPWPGPHLNVGDKGFHVLVPKGWSLPR